MLFIFTFVFIAEVTSFNYCQLDCNGAEHTMCKFKIGGGMDCPKNRNEVLTVREKKSILEFHNSKRQKIADGEVSVGDSPLPHAGNMMKLIWDKELNMFAKRWADQCHQGEHDICRRTMNGQDPGQNSYIGTYKDPGDVSLTEKQRQRHDRIMKILATWFDEKDSLDGQNLDRLKYEESWGASAGHFIQMIWAQTTFIACAYSAFNEEDSNVKYRFICNYKVKGNNPGFALYRKGKACSSCPQNTDCSTSFEKLCWNKYINNFGESGSERIHSLKVLELGTILFLSGLIVK